MSSKTEKSFASSRWENEGGALGPATHEAEIPEKLAGRGIKTIRLTTCEWSGYRYTNMKDAIAPAERSATA